jgi:hypothetical protein
VLLRLLGGDLAVARLGAIDERELALEELGQ